MSELEYRLRIAKVQNDLNDTIKTLHLQLNLNNLNPNLLSNIERYTQIIKSNIEMYSDENLQAHGSG